MASDQPFGVIINEHEGESRSGPLLKSETAIIGVAVVTNGDIPSAVEWRGADQFRVARSVRRCDEQHAVRGIHAGQGNPCNALVEHKVLVLVDPLDAVGPHAESLGSVLERSFTV